MADKVHEVGTCAKMVPAEWLIIIMDHYLVKALELQAEHLMAVYLQ